MPDSIYDKLGELLSEALESGNFFYENPYSAQNTQQKSYEKEKIFSDFIYSDTGGRPRFDFYLPDFNRLIEFDGKQHFIDTGWTNQHINFEKRKSQDKLKNIYAKKNNIELIRIPYWERNNITLEMILGNQYLQ